MTMKTISIRVTMEQHSVNNLIMCSIRVIVMCSVINQNEIFHISGGSITVVCLCLHEDSLLAEAYHCMHA